MVSILNSVTTPSFKTSNPVSLFTQLLGLPTQASFFIPLLLIAWLLAYSKIPVSPSLNSFPSVSTFIYSSSTQSLRPTVPPILVKSLPTLLDYADLPFLCPSGKVLGKYAIYFSKLFHVFLSCQLDSKWEVNKTLDHLFFNKYWLSYSRLRYLWDTMEWKMTPILLLTQKKSFYSQSHLHCKCVRVRMWFFNKPFSAKL